MKRILRIASAAIIVALLAACSKDTYKNINYLQDIEGDDTQMRMSVNQGIIIQPQDQLSIIVNSRDPRLSAQFNKSVSTFVTGTEMSSTSGGTQRITGYTVDNDGYIYFPSLGLVEAAGHNRWELQDIISKRLADEGLLKDAVVTVEFLNFKISVLGEVTSPGSYTITGDKINIFQALALAKDLTIHGQRNNVMVIRERQGSREIYEVDLRSSDIFRSPAYYLQQNDVIYVTPSKVRAGQSTINENYFKSGSFWISLTSLAATLTTLIINITK